MIDRYARLRMKEVWSDKSKYDKWLQLELAVCEAWTRSGVIPIQDMERLRNANYNSDRLAQIFQRTRHDVTAFLQSVTEGLGPEGRWLHLGLTSSDVIDTSQCLQLRDASDLLLEDIDALIEELERGARDHKETLIMGRTHGVHAEPTTFGLKLALWLHEMRRQRGRMEKAREEIAVGKISGVVGTHATVPPAIEEWVCDQLGLQIAPISSQVIQRDRHAYFLVTIAVIAASLEKFATEIRSLQRTEIHEVEEAFGEGQTGSSAMPHKRNPELSERVCGLARLIRGFAVTGLENVALWHERDISHSSAERVILPDACMALDYILDLFTGIMRNLKVFPERMLQNIESSRGVVFSQRVLLAMVEKGMNREEAYAMVQRHAQRAWDYGEDFRELLRQDSEISKYLSTEALEELFDCRYYVRYVDEMYQRSGLLTRS